MIRTENLSIDLGEFRLKNVTVEIKEGEYFVLLGPTGAGKTVFIECLAGLYKPDSGRIYLLDEDITDLPPEERGMGYVPQDYALFTHMNVYENIAYGLKERRVPRREVKKRVEEIADLLGIGHLLHRRPSTLSGGEQQRVALARALAIRPRVLLLDEPLSALDEVTRDETIAELRRIHEETGTTVVHVCHDFDEMLALADRVGVINDGVLLQVGTPLEVLWRPADEFVARFMGAENIFYGVARPDGEGSAVSIREGLWLRVPRRESGEVVVVVRPESVKLSAEPCRGPNCFRGRILSASLRKASVRVEVDIGVPLVTYIAEAEFRALGAGPGRPVFAHIDGRLVHLLKPRGNPSGRG